MQFCDVSDPASFERQEVHPLGSRAKVLLTSIFGPYGQDDEYGSRASNPMELYHNQVTRIQGPFSLRMFHRSCGLMLIQANISALCTLLDYPVLDRFIQELLDKTYDIIGISGIPQNIKKVEKMCELIREHQPGATIVVGGHISNIANLDKRIDADYVVRGEGVRWFRRFLGEDLDQPIKHPQILSAVNPRCMGMNLSARNRHASAVLIPSVGCPIGCNFCSTSVMFGGKGKFVNFYETGDELFDIMSQLEKEMRVRSFMVVDDNFLLQRRRALRLLELMQSHEKAWALYVFGSADALKSYTIEQLVGLGISWLWIGLEGRDSQYGKLKDIDTRSLVRELQANGIRLLASTIIGMEEHTPENIDKAIEWAVSHNADWHQFMLYIPAHGTPLRAELGEKGELFDESVIEEADAHGQYRFNYRHPHIKDGQETEFLLRAFRRDFEVNGPSVMRMMRTLMDGWMKYKNHREVRIRKRFSMTVERMPTLYAGALWATRCWFKDRPRIAGKMSDILEDIHREFGLKSRLAAPILGRVVLCLLRKEEKRLAAGHTCEPPTFYESSAKVVRLTKKAVPDRNRLFPASLVKKCKVAFSTIKTRLILGIFLSVMLSCICVAQLFPADVEWTIKKQLNLKASPLDISTSIDGQWIFILAQGEVLVYSIPEDKVVNRIPVDKDFDRLTHSPKNNTLVLSSRSGKTVKIIQLEVIHTIDTSALPFKGPEHAPVTMAVFGDYQ